MTTIPIPPNEARIHVLAIADGGEPIPPQTYLTGQAADSAPLRAALGASVVTQHIEVFRISDLAPLSLRDYLRQAHDVPAAALQADGARLDALTGSVIVIAPAGLDGVGALQPQPHITHVGAYGAPVPDDTPTPMPRSETPPRIATPAVAAGKGFAERRIVWIVLAALALAVVLVLAL